MSKFEVFRPSDGPLQVPGNFEGAMMSTDTFRKEQPRPSTQSGYRFGQLSHNSFFTRHNPHPFRVKHIKGLLDVPICAVNDNGYVSNARYSITGSFPPNNFNASKLSNSRYHIPVNAININSQLHPINTVTGLQYFTGLQSYPFREKAVPQVGLVPVIETWRDELRNLTEAAGLLAVEKRKEDMKKETENKLNKSVYSTETGRLIPPPSRAMTRQGSRQARRDQMGRYFEHIAGEPDQESMVLQMLCQILQTDDVNAVQSWLVSAGEREKCLVLDLIKSAIASKDEYYNQSNTEFIQPETDQPRPQTDQPRPQTSPMKFIDHQTETSAITQKQEESRIEMIERMSLENVSPRAVAGEHPANDVTQWTRYSWSTNKANNNVMDPKLSAHQRKPVIPENDVLKPPKCTDMFRVKHSPRERPLTNQAPFKPSTPMLRYSQTPKKETDIAEKWEPAKSTVEQ